jgi:peptidoglycan/LPS O-acetylase OafA/YrhL
MPVSRISSLDGMRLVAAFMVVCLHCGLTGNRFADYVITNFCYIAVPYFFSLSGYFIYSEDRENEKAKIRKALKRMTVIYLAVISAYVVIDIINTQSLDIIKTEWSIVLTSQFWLFNQTPDCPVLWYISAYIYMLLILYFIGKNHRLILTLAAISAIATIAMGPYAALWMSGGNSMPINTSFIGNFCFLVCGYVIRKNNIEEKFRNRHLLYCLLAIALLLPQAEHYFIRTATASPVIGNCYIGILIACPLLLLSLLKSPSALGKLSAFNSKISLDVYLWHIAVFQTLSTWADYPILTNAVSVFLITFLLSFCIRKTI